MSEVVTVTVLRETEDVHGDVTLTTVGTVTGCIWWPLASTEDEDGRHQVLTRRGLVAPAGHGITATHRVRFPGSSTTWTVAGDPKPWRSPWGWSPGEELALESVRG